MMHLPYWVSRCGMKACSPPAEIPSCSAHGSNRAPGSKSSFHVHPRVRTRAHLITTPMGIRKMRQRNGASLLYTLRRITHERFDVECRVRHQDVGYVKFTKPHPSLIAHTSTFYIYSCIDDRIGE